MTKEMKMSTLLISDSLAVLSRKYDSLASKSEEKKHQEINCF